MQWTLRYNPPRFTTQLLIYLRLFRSPFMTSYVSFWHCCSGSIKHTLYKQLLLHSRTHMQNWQTLCICIWRTSAKSLHCMRASDIDIVASIRVSAPPSIAAVGLVLSAQYPPVLYNTGYSAGTCQGFPSFRFAPRFHTSIPFRSALYYIINFCLWHFPWQSSSAYGFTIAPSASSSTIYTRVG